jgi:hypothetical protein
LWGDPFGSPPGFGPASSGEVGLSISSANVFSDPLEPSIQHGLNLMLILYRGGPAAVDLHEIKHKLMKRTLAIWALTASGVMAQSTVTGSKTMQGSWDASGASATKPAKSGATLPATCNIGEFFFNTAAAAGQNLYLCASANTWTQVTSGGGGGAVNSVFGRTGTVSAQSGDYSFSQLSGTASSGQLPAAGGDLSGALTSPTVTGIQGRSLSSTAPSTGQVLTWNGSAWLAQTPSGGGGGASLPAAVVFDGSTTSLADGSTVS